jgi:SAM-dependent methyltransferase
VKAFLKHIIYKLGFAGFLDRALYVATGLRHRNANRSYLEQHPGAVLPPDYWLYETYRLDYRKFVEDGLVAGKEILEWTRPYLPMPPRNILDWGCGAGRITQHLPKLMPAAGIYGCDTNLEMIEWDEQHYRGVQFSHIAHDPPTPYAQAQFDLVFGISVFTHIDVSAQASWLAELHRILAKDAVLLITTHGSHYENKLLKKQKRALRKIGIFTVRYPHKGHRMLSTYHDAKKFRELLSWYFIILEHHDGKSEPGKIGGQDVWILRRKNIGQA